MEKTITSANFFLRKHFKIDVLSFLHILLNIYIVSTVYIAHVQIVPKYWFQTIGRILHASNPTKIF